MAKVNVAADNIPVRASSIEENRAILREIQAKKEVDARKHDELSQLFDDINAACASRSLKEKKKSITLASSDKVENTSRPARYGPLPGYLPGKWWGIRMDCSRDCVHEPFNESIHEGPYGAVSICTSHLNTHNDIDLGSVLTFTSGEYNPTNKSADSLVLSYKNQVPIRLVRSYCLSNKYAPKTGYRYDGLYTVVRHWIAVSTDASKHHKFVLTRCLNQEPPPWLDKKVNFKSARLKKAPCRLTRSHSTASDQDSKTRKFVYNRVEKKSKAPSVSAIVSRQAFDKCASSSPDTSRWKSSINSDSTNQILCTTLCPAKLCSTNLSIRTNLYDSSHQAQDLKKSVSSVCKIYKPNRLMQLPQVSIQQSSTVASEDQSDGEARSNAASTINESAVKKVTWADACSARRIRMDKCISTCTSNGFQYSRSGLVDSSNSESRKKGCAAMKYNNNCPSATMGKHKSAMATKTSDISQNSAVDYSTVHDLLHETEKMSESSSIDSLAPDELVNVIVKEKYHPMAKLLIGNMIGLENQEAAFVNAYNALTKVNQDESKQAKENKLRNKFSIKSPSKKNGILKKQRREIANLAIDANFNTRSSRSRGLGANNKRILKAESSRRKLLSARRIQSRSKGLAVNREANSKIHEKEKKVPKMVTRWTQCCLLAAPTVDQCQQTDDSHTQTPSKDVPVERIHNSDDVQSKFRNSSSLTCSSRTTRSSKISRAIGDSYVGSAFAAVSADSNDRIARLRSIGFRPIGSNSPISDAESSRPDVNQEYNRYTSEENDVVGYMDVQLHFQDIEEEEEKTTKSIKQEEEAAIKSMEEDSISLQAGYSANILPQPIETLTEQDFNKPWHGWRKISINGQTYWTGC